tara:strand:+ start:315 stop:824 length:510 start_codon:yes stop_codon:yes gene_type:complete
MIELERTFLLKELPSNLESCPKKEVIDIYIPPTSHHPCLRIRKNGNTYEITKKAPIKDGDASKQKEHTIPLTPEEFHSLQSLNGKKVSKIRYQYTWQNKICEIDIFQDLLTGLALIDFEFDSEQEKDSFPPPPFCGPEVTQETCIAGGILAGKSFDDIKHQLEKLSPSQ